MDKRIPMVTYSATFDCGDSLGDDVFKATDGGEIPADAVVVTIFDYAGRRFASQWAQLDKYGSDRAVQARAIGESLLDALDRAGGGASTEDFTV